MKHNHISATISIIGLAALILLLTLTSPTEIGPLGVLLFFTTLYVVFFGIFTALVSAYRLFAFHQKDFSNKNYLYSAVLAFGPIMLLMVRSFGAITPWTIFLIILFLALAEFLVAKRA